MMEPTGTPRDRRARFGLPALTAGPACRVVVARLQRLEASTPALWGRMSAGAMICHLSDTFRVMLGERASGVADLADLADLDETTRRRLRRTAIKWLALYVPIRWPHGLRTLPTVDLDRDGSRPGDFEHDRGELVRYAERVAAGELPTDGQHPMLGRLSAWEWRRWAYLHVDHHLRQFGR